MWCFIQFLMQLVTGYWNKKFSIVHTYNVNMCCWQYRVPFLPMVNRAAMSSWSCLSLERIKSFVLTIYWGQSPSPKLFFFCRLRIVLQVLHPTRDKTQHREVVRHASDNWVKMSCGYRTMCGNHVRILRQMMWFVLMGLGMNTIRTENDYVWQYVFETCTPWLWSLNALWCQSIPRHFSAVSLEIYKTYPPGLSPAIMTKVHAKIYE